MSVTGLERMQRLLGDKSVLPPVCEIAGMTLELVEPGRIIWRAVPPASFENGMGMLHGGYAGLLLDSCMGGAVRTKLSAGMGYATTEFKTNILKPIRSDVGALLAEGEAITVGKQVGTAKGVVRNADGQVYAHGTTTCLIFEEPTR